MNSRFFRLPAVLLLCVLLFSAVPLARPVNADPRPSLSLHVFSFGKADAFLFSTQEGAVLIDCGLNGQGKEILSYLADHDIREIHTLIITHFDKDHVGGASKVLKGIPVKRVLQSDSPKDSKEYEKYLKALTQSSLDPITVREVLSFSLGDVEFTVFPPEQDSYSKDPSNNSSLATLIKYGDTSFLFTGDAESARLQELLKTGFGTVGFLQIPHHGSWQTLLGALLNYVSPDYALITSSEEEPEDFVTLQLLQKFGAETLLTREGELDIISDGSALSVSQKGETLTVTLSPAA